MNDGIRFDVAAQQDLVARMTRAIEGIGRVLETLDGEVATLAGRWTGEAQQAYAAAQRGWTNQLTALTALASQANQSLGTASTTYDEAERRAAERWAL